jgi:hypothetical protein
LGAILNTLADILNTFSASVLPFMQDGVLAAATMTAHGDHQVRKVRCQKSASQDFHSCALTAVAAGLCRADQGRRCLCKAFSARLCNFNYRYWSQGQHVQVSVMMLFLRLFTTSHPISSTVQRHDGSCSAVAARQVQVCCQSGAGNVLNAAACQRAFIYPRRQYLSCSISSVIISSIFFTPIEHPFPSACRASCMAVRATPRLQ